jgi:parallel beta helix pectate lyase-like protein/fibronectin type III domain protein
LRWARSYSAGRYRVFRNGHVLARHLRRARYVDRSVKRGRTYSYSVQACTRRGCSARSRAARVHTPGRIPWAPREVTARVTGSRRVGVQWRASRGARKYRLIRNGHLLAWRLHRLWYTDSSIRSGDYAYSVKACNPAGCSRPSQVARVTTAPTGPPPAPAGVGAVANDATRVTVRWRASSGAADYRVVRDGSTVATARATTRHVDSDLAPATAYSYSVVACNSLGCSPPSDAARAATPKVMPLAPTGLSAAADGPGVTVGWNASPAAATYRLYRNGTLLTSGLTLEAYADSAVAPDTFYFYLVVACDPSGCSPPSRAAAVRTPAPYPQPSCKGVSVTAGTDLQAAIKTRPDGTTFCLAAGTYHVRSTIVPKSSDVLWGVPGTVLTGDNATATGIRGYSSYQVDVIVRGITMTRFTGAGGVISLGNGWLVEDNEIAYNGGVGLRASSGSTVRDNLIHHNGQYGLTGGPMSNALVEDNEIAFNNTAHNSSWNAGGTKVIKSSYVVFRRNYVHDNIGAGLHCDTDCIHIIYEQNLVEDNTKLGIFHEASYDSVIRDNVVAGNDADEEQQTLFFGAQVYINDSRNVEVAGNFVQATAPGTNGIGLWDYDRGSGPYGEYQIANEYIHDNVVVLGSGGDTGLVGSFHAPTSANNRFADNTYWVDDLAARYFYWGSGRRPLDWGAWKAKQQDTSGLINA